MDNHLSREPLSGYRPCVGIFILNREAQVFVGQRADVRHEAWQMPQGGIDDGEEPREAAVREMREEIGTSNAEILRESSFWRSYDLPPEAAARSWGGRFKGQTQRWIALRFLGSDEEIDLDGPEAEFSAWRWTSPDELGGLIVPFKREVYESVVEEFRPLWS